MHQRPHDHCQVSSKAAVEAIEERNYGVVLPMQFVLRYIPKDGLPNQS